MSYPKWLYHETKEATVVNSEQEHKALGKGWEETPTAFDKKAKQVEKESDKGQEVSSEASK